jgi:hypothetical protein
MVFKWQFALIAAFIAHLSSNINVLLEYDYVGAAIALIAGLIAHRSSNIIVPLDVTSLTKNYHGLLTERLHEN